MPSFTRENFSDSLHPENRNFKDPRKWISTLSQNKTLNAKLIFYFLHSKKYLKSNQQIQKKGMHLSPGKTKKFIVQYFIIL